jgi:hypothetical protein
MPYVGAAESSYATCRVRQVAAQKSRAARLRASEQLTVEFGVTWQLQWRRNWGSTPHEACERRISRGAASQHAWQFSYCMYI